MSLSYSQCKASINAAIENNKDVNTLVVEAFQKSITAAALAIFWLMQKLLAGPSAIINKHSKYQILQMLSAINEPKDFYETDFTDTSLVEETDDFIVIDHDSAELKCFAEHLYLDPSRYFYCFVELVELIKKCNQMMVKYYQGVSNPIVISGLFGGTEIVIGIVKRVWKKPWLMIMTTTMSL